MLIIDQPFGESLGFRLIEQLQSRKYNRFEFSVAYAKTSGVNRLLPYMRELKNNGGTIRAVVGIDQGNTSYEALVELLSVCDDLYIYHSEDFRSTFHVKAYLLVGAQGSWGAVGSNNFTAGGLFSNYEASMVADDAPAFEAEFTEMFERYSDVTSPCCKLADADFIDQLLACGYVQRENVLARQRLATARRPNAVRGTNEVLFGRDVVAPLPRVVTGTAPRTRATNSPVAQPATQLPDEADYLIRHVPRAGNRSSQVHFTLDILKNYFRLSVGDDLALQEISLALGPRTLEHRQIVLSGANRNVKVEVRAAEVLDDNYPADPEKRPILLFKRINPTMFEYMLLMAGDQGYDELNNRLLGLNWHGRSLPYEIVDTDAMLTIWDSCPLI